MQGSKQLIPDGTDSTQWGYFRDLRSRDVECVDLPIMTPGKKVGLIQGQGREIRLSGVAFYSC